MSKAHTRNGTENQSNSPERFSFIDQSVAMVNHSKKKASPINPPISNADLKKYMFLFEKTDLFRHFIDPSILKQVDARLREESFVKLAVKSKSIHRKQKPKQRSSADQDDEIEGSDNENNEIYFTESPSFIKGGTMRSYQVEGLNWLISLHHNNINGILADEMGLGKTLQTISLIGYLKSCKQEGGPHLFLVPKSTLQNWLNEFRKWLPSVNPFILHGNPEERKEAIRDKIKRVNFDVCITSYEICLIERSALGKINWNYIVIDEAHRIKNEHSILSQIIRLFHSQHRLLLTGTPLQNNLHELWALLNFLLPDVFGSVEVFNEYWLGKKEDDNTQKDKNQELMVTKLRSLLEPFLLRRLKIDVEHSLPPKKEIYLWSGMSELQRKWYQKILQKDVSSVVTNLGFNASIGASGGGETKTRLLNVAMQLRKCCNHPYLFDGAEPGPPFTNDKHLVDSCGKMKLLDRLLDRFKANGSRVLLFSQMSRMLDVFEDYCNYKEFSYCRIDGQTSHQERIEAIDDFNRPGSDKFLFLLTTRAGGLGINLVTADVVILYDSDWNPQVDLQAQDRAHRIGQTKQVYVFRLITEGAIEEKVVERALQKLRLDQLVIQQQQQSNENNSALSLTAQQSKTLSSKALLQMISHGAKDIFSQDCNLPSSIDDIEEAIKSGEERTKKMHEKYSNVGLEDLQKFSLISSIPASNNAASAVVGDVEINELAASDIFNILQLHPTTLAKRERKPNTSYSVDNYFREAMSGGSSSQQAGSSSSFANSVSSVSSSSQIPPKPPKLPVLHDFQFYPKYLHRLLEKETLFYQQSIGYKIPQSNNAEGLGISSVIEEQEKINLAIKLSSEELAEKELLLSQGFSSWSKKDFALFIKGCEKYGRDNIEKIHAEINSTGSGDDGKSVEQVCLYSKTFWSRYREIDGWEKIVAVIEKGEAKLERSLKIHNLLESKISHECSISDLSGSGSGSIDRDNWQALKLDFIPSYHSISSTTTTPALVNSSSYSPDEDRFLLFYVWKFCCLTTDGVSSYDLILRQIKREPVFEFDWFFKTRSLPELTRRAMHLVGLLEKSVAKQHALADKKKDLYDRGTKRVEFVDNTPNSLLGEKESKMGKLETVPPSTSSIRNGGGCRSNRAIAKMMDIDNLINTHSTSEYSDRLSNHQIVSTEKAPSACSIGSNPPPTSTNKHHPSMRMKKFS